MCCQRRRSYQAVFFSYYKRSRSQSAIVQAILEQRDPDEEEVEFFNQYTAKIDEVRNNMYALQRELDNLEYR